MRFHTRHLGLALAITWAAAAHAQSYRIVDTGQETCYDNSREITPPQQGEPFYGQDAQHEGNGPAYLDNGDGTVTDLNTGLMWQQDLPGAKYSHVESGRYADTCAIGGYTDWRLPTIKELYSLMLFSGRTGMSESSSLPYLDTGYFDFRFGGTVASGERYIDAQYATSTIYQGTTMGGNETMFGVNFVDGRIKGYPTHKLFEVKLVRGGDGYGVNDFVDNGDATITDRATGLMWDQSGSSDGMNWAEALAWAQERGAANHLGHSDWRLPDAKELQSIVDYERSPSHTRSAAISPLFGVPVIVDEKGDDNYPCYWTSTTHYDGPGPVRAVYVSFGEALGNMRGRWTDVHGAGAQRSDPKTGDPANYADGLGPQGDAIRIYNHVRLVRDVGSSDATVPTGIMVPSGEAGATAERPQLDRNYPNPFNPSTTLSFQLPSPARVSLRVYNAAGQHIQTLVDEQLPAGPHALEWSAAGLPSGTYLYTLMAGSWTAAGRMLLLK